ncbi:hypothetical protein LOSG293_370160 [Secundilactobacillus oryzae JCM 18671]|uniref:HTH cro/C1-type domain-containing protein n=1 Tax=Secundilactobacillus oryzae JCM 18671 TaxID=1291743 RepID=A0A081BKJ0_9LACO|nr:hypothetical protein LOSG293_370160 [Secundilactobacillus oryzae JCM 18671]
MKIGEHLREIRGQFGYSQEDVADRIHVSRQTISNWKNEHSFPDIQSLLLLADLYQLTLDDLIKGDLDMIESKKTIRKLILNTVGLMVMVVLSCLVLYFWQTVPLTGALTLILYGICWLIGIYFAWKVYRIQGQKDIWTMAEIRYYMKTGQLKKSRNRKRQIWLETGIGAVLGALTGIGVAMLLF